MLYGKALSRVMNNGFMTGPFSVSRGVRQGHPLSSTLLIITLETIAINIRIDNSIKSIQSGDEIR